ncbi:exported hypothetical protein [Candidatus Sulfotelmatomonas gaucii]|uniref:Lipoprotein n=1 Tax=Candidatus Sulfuritelmatomonas gaucii TaxID=2043161 RepID=A0A2N9M849_9BACT|nr:exported hypothetical protein [Candidatus Sulfotelmatomonas gaucii]
MAARVIFCFLMLLSSTACVAQTPLHGLISGQSQRADVEKVAGKPVKFDSQTLVEYQPQEFDPKTWDKNIAKMYVQYRDNSPIVERLELMLAKPISRADALTDLNHSTAAARQPNLPAKAAAQGNTGQHAVEYFAAPHYIVITYAGVNTQSGVEHYGSYSPALFASAVNSLAGPGAPAAMPTSASVSRSGPVDLSGTWYSQSGCCVYKITQNGNQFHWERTPPESADGMIDSSGSTFSAQFHGPPGNGGSANGTGTTTGMAVLDSAGHAVAIKLSNKSTLSRTPTSPAAPASSAAATNGTVTGRWSGNWTNSHGASGQNLIMNLNEQNGTITGDDNGTPIVNGRRTGNVLTWENLNVANCRDYTVRAEISADGNLLNGTYQVNDRCGHQTYNGKYLNFHR